MCRSSRSGPHCRFSLDFVLLVCWFCLLVCCIELGTQEIWDYSCTKCHCQNRWQGKHFNQMCHFVDTRFEFPFDVTFSFTFDLVGLLGNPRKGYGNEFFGFLLFCFHSYDLKKKRIETFTNPPFRSCFSCIFVLFFVLGGESHKIWAKIPIYPWF